MKYTCYCGKSFESAYALSGHKRSHSPAGFKSPFISKMCVIETREEITTSSFQTYLDSIINCKLCNSRFHPKSKSIFCSRSCSATYNNTNRTVTTGGTKTFNCVSCGIKTTASNRCNPLKIKCNDCKTKKNKVEKINTEKKLYERKCAHCHSTFISKKILKYCEEHRFLYSQSNKQGYKFTFNVFDYPDLFDLEEIKNIGFYCNRGGVKSKNKKLNLNGLSRDHKISVTDAIKNSYDPYYISHPLNCQIMTHADNSKKHSKSSISYCDLVKLVDEYDNKNKNK
jgi:hypothetical protein